MKEMDVSDVIKYIENKYGRKARLYYRKDEVELVITDCDYEEWETIRDDVHKWLRLSDAEELSTKIGLTCEASEIYNIRRRKK